jgi:hypothetical protein
MNLLLFPSVSAHLSFLVQPLFLPNLSKLCQENNGACKRTARFSIAASAKAFKN